MMKFSLTVGMVAVTAVITGVMTHRDGSRPIEAEVAPRQTSSVTDQGGQHESQKSAHVSERQTQTGSQLSASRPPLVAAPEQASLQVRTADEKRRADAELRAVDEERRRAYMSGVAQSFAVETVDTTWAFAAAATVQEAFNADEALQGFTRRLDCRTTTCRLEIDDDGSGKLARALPLLLGSIAEELPGTVAERVRSGAENRMVLYMSRAQGTQTTSQLQTSYQK